MSTSNSVVTETFIKINNHWEDKTTYILGDYIKNGCQLFHVRDIDKVCDTFKVPDNVKNQVLKRMSKMKLGTEEEYIQIFNKYRNECSSIFFINGLFKDVAIGKVDGECALVKGGHCLEELSKSTFTLTRMEVVKQGYNLDYFMNDNNISVRCQLVIQGYGIDTLVNDKSCYVRREVAHNGYKLETLINDEYPSIRIEVARKGYGLEKLINDENEYVRIEVAKQGYGLDILINDPDPDVRFVVSKMLARQRFNVGNK